MLALAVKRWLAKARRPSLPVYLGPRDLIVVAILLIFQHL